MSDPIFLRNSMSSSVYAEQMNSAQVQGQAASRERAARARQERLKNEQVKIKGLQESGKSQIGDREARQHHAEYEDDPERESAEDRDDSIDASKEAGEFRRIDLTA